MAIKISIIMPVYNRSTTVCRALDSLLAQNYKNFEVIIVNDGSSDTSAEKIQSYLHDERFRFVELTRNSGVNHARNYGFSHIAADSDWVTFLDSDDEFVTDALENIVSVVSAYPTVKDYCFSVRYLDGRAASHLAVDNQIFNYRDLFDVKSKPTGEWVHVINAQLVRDRIFRYEESVRNGFEAIAYLRLARDFPVLYSSKVVRLYHLDVEGLTRIANKTVAKSHDEIIGYSIFLKEFGDMLFRYSKLEYALILSVLGKTFLEVSDFRNCIKYTSKAFFCNPFELRVYRNVLLMFKFLCLSLFKRITP